MDLLQLSAQLLRIDNLIIGPLSGNNPTRRRRQSRPLTPRALSNRTRATASVVHPCMLTVHAARRADAAVSRGVGGGGGGEMLALLSFLPAVAAATAAFFAGDYDVADLHRAHALCLVVDAPSLVGSFNEVAVRIPTLYLI